MKHFINTAKLHSLTAMEGRLSLAEKIPGNTSERKHKQNICSQLTMAKGRREREGQGAEELRLSNVKRLERMRHGEGNTSLYRCPGGADGAMLFCFFSLFFSSAA